MCVCVCVCVCVCDVVVHAMFCGGGHRHQSTVCLWWAAQGILGGTAIMCEMGWGEGCVMGGLWDVFGVYAWV